MKEKAEKSPFVIEFKNNYGTTSLGSSQPSTPTTLYCLHGKNVELRGHCHKQRSEGVDVKARKKLIIASVLCLVFMVAEIVGGVLSNSLAIATDAAHLLTDFASFMISLFAIWIAGRPSTQRMSFGWYRAEVIGALASVVMIWFITAILVWLAIQRVITGEYEVDATVMLITSGLAILVNLIMGFQLQHGHTHGGGGGHGHSHGGGKKRRSMANAAVTIESLTASATTVAASTTTISTLPSSASIEGGVGVLPLATTTTTTPSADTKATFAYQNAQNSLGEIKAEIASAANVAASSGVATPATTRKFSIHNQHGLPIATHGGDENMNVRAAYIHVVGDVLQSVGVFIAALVIYFRPDWAIADPICTFLFSIIVLFTTFSILKDALLVLMEGTPTYLHYAEVMGIFQQIEGVERVHNLRIWALSINKIALSVHLAIGPTADPKTILQKASTAVHLKYNFFETTIQIEDFMPEMEDCHQCIVPQS